MTFLEPDRFPSAWRGLTASLLLACTPVSGEAMETPVEGLSEGVQQLRHAVGIWNVTTTQYSDDGTVSHRMKGTFQFEWVVPDRVLSGRSTMPAGGQNAGVLLYVNERRATIEMASVGADGNLWVMSGPADGEIRMTPPMPMSDGSRMQLRYTRFNVAPNRFEARVDVSTDGGASWHAGRHQLFVRNTSDGTSAGGMRYRKRTQPYIPLT